MSDDYRKVCKLLKQHGYKLVRTRGSHQIWRGKGGHVSVPYKSTRKRTLNRILKNAGIGERGLARKVRIFALGNFQQTGQIERGVARLRAGIRRTRFRPPVLRANLRGGSQDPSLAYGLVTVEQVGAGLVQDRLVSRPVAVWQSGQAEIESRKLGLEQWGGLRSGPLRVAFFKQEFQFA